MGATFHDGSISIMLQYANRHSLLEMLKTYGAFSEICLQRIALHTFRGLELLHSARVIHRDIKPGNILLDSSFRCCLTDFGVVTALEGTMDLASTIVGTTLFFAPERVTQEGKYSYASDVWSLGVTLWYLAVGVLPYPATGGYWGIVKAIRDEPVPQLPAVHPGNREGVFSRVQGPCWECACRKIQQREHPASVLLQHPFLKNAEAQWEAALASSTQPPHVLMDMTDNDRADLDAVLMVLYRAHYSGGRGEYRKSLMELARFQKLAENLNNRQISVQVVQARFEELYKKARAEGK